MSQEGREVLACVNEDCDEDALFVEGRDNDAPFCPHCGSLRQEVQVQVIASAIAAPEPREVEKGDD